jgi:hypothetical protein
LLTFYTDYFTILHVYPNLRGGTMAALLPLDGRLRPLLAKVGIGSWQVLSDRSNIGLKRIRQMRRGNWDSFRIEDLRRLAGVLEIPLEALLSVLSVGSSLGDSPRSETESNPERAWQLAAFQQLESFLTYWPAAAYHVEQGGDLTAAKLLPLVKPIERLLASWQIEPLGPVGEILPFDPQQHQATEGAIETGSLVRVRYPGYRQAVGVSSYRLLRRAQVELDY